MAVILFLVDYEEGHIFPTFGLATFLAERGHSIHYVSVVDNEKYIISRGFIFHSICENEYPKGSRENFKLDQIQNRVSSKLTYCHALDPHFGNILKKVKPDLLIVNTFLSLEALLIYYRFKIQPIIFTPYLLSDIDPQHEGYNNMRYLPMPVIASLLYHAPIWNRTSGLSNEIINPKHIITRARLKKFLRPLNNFVELVACPKELDYNPHFNKSNRIHLGPSIRTGSNRRSFSKGKPNNKIIFASLGSQTARIFQNSFKFYQCLIKVMRDPGLCDTQLVISTGEGFDLESFKPLPSNVQVYNWVDQIDILQLSSLAIIHGGLGSVKECIYFGVPMIVYPGMYDQPRNAMLVKHHGLGVQDDFASVSEDQLKANIMNVMTNDVIRRNVKKMKAIFREKEESNEGYRFIEKYLR
ncbi:hypothetical protein A3860_05480 [Niastella vici]|uniref:Uncharacterized protein n=1 Tax=Niastella vici TaxID=1703345 RepID=A0A1V9FS73_9BACT|nr:nucleotide disphospho-sugar-binding domain-containing protein [Niastella vici]OQP61168.1 hypothetical protein A3860_05480 [Niastella vici]